MARLSQQTIDKVKTLASGTDLNKSEIARAANVARSTVYEIIQQDINSDQFIHFQNNKDKIFESLQLQLLNCADTETLKHIVRKRGFTDVAILQDKIALLRNQPTSITDYQIRVVLDAIPNNNNKLSNDSKQDDGDVIECSTDSPVSNIYAMIENDTKDKT